MIVKIGDPLYIEYVTCNSCRHTLPICKHLFQVPEGFGDYGNRASKAFIHLFAIASAFVSQLDFLHKSESLWSNFSSNSFSQSLFFISKPFVLLFSL